MFQALTRIMLALAVVFTFTGQMEAAAAHCARLAQDAALAAPDTGSAATPDCHGAPEAANAPSHHAGAHHSAPAPDLPAPDHCDCIAALKVCASPNDLPGSTRISPYAWLSPADARFVSFAPSPGLRPPRT